MAIKKANKKVASATFNSKTKDWDWDEVTWNLGKDNIYYSNRHYPKKFWNKKWDRSQRDVAGVLLCRLNKEEDNLEVFIVQCYKNKWGFPKGKTDKGETFKKGACREFHEESGTIIDLDNATELKIIDNSKRRRIIFFYKIEDSTFEIITKPRATVEITAFGWVPIENILDYNISISAKKVLKKISSEIPPEFPDMTKNILSEFKTKLVKGSNKN